MPRLWARTVTFESVNVGDQLPILVKWETNESIKGFEALVSSTARDEEKPDQHLSLDPAALVSYVTELLEKAFPIVRIMAQGSQLQFEPVSPVRPEDTISLSGEVVGKRQDGDQRLVECAITIENQDGETVGRAAAVVSL